MLLLLVLAALVQLSYQQCLTAKDEVRQLSSAAYLSLQQSQRQFSADLLRAAASHRPDANLLMSPSSVFQASLLAYFMSANQTEQSLKKALHMAANDDKLDIYGAYSMENYYQKLRVVRGRSYQLSSANRLYIAKDLKVNYCMKVLFADELCPANFQENSKGVVKKINQWVGSQTRNVIKDFLPEDAVRKDTQIVLVNAAYFKGKWKSPFNEDETYKRNFHLSNGTEMKTSMMTQEGKFRYKVDKKLGVEVVEIPYVGENISMYVLLPLKPSKSAIPDLLKKMDAEALQSVVQALGAKENLGPKRTITIPKFTMETELDLTPVLESLGVGDLFKKSGDLSTLAPDLNFSEAVHKAKIRVDEKGSEAAAATSFISARVYIESFDADHPFIYTIYDKTANIPLFFGVFNHPVPEPEST